MHHEVLQATAGQTLAGISGHSQLPEKGHPLDEPRELRWWFYYLYSPVSHKLSPWMVEWKHPDLRGTFTTQQYTLCRLLGNKAIHTLLRDTENELGIFAG